MHAIFQQELNVTLDDHCRTLLPSKLVVLVCVKFNLIVNRLCSEEMADDFLFSLTEAEQWDALKTVLARVERQKLSTQFRYCDVRYLHLRNNTD
jgi:hypothetical protein